MIELSKLSLYLLSISFYYLSFRHALLTFLIMYTFVLLITALCTYLLST